MLHNNIIKQIFIITLSILVITASYAYNIPSNKAKKYLAMAEHQSWLINILYDKANNQLITLDSKKSQINIINLTTQKIAQRIDLPVCSNVGSNFIVNLQADFAKHKLYVGDTAKHVYIVDLKSYQYLGLLSKPAADSTMSMSSMALDQNMHRLYIADGFGYRKTGPKFYIVDTEQDKVIDTIDKPSIPGENPHYGWLESGVAVSNDHKNVYLSSMLDGHLYTFNTNTKQFDTQPIVDKDFYSSIINTPDKDVFYTASDSTVYKVDLKKPQTQVLFEANMILDLAYSNKQNYLFIPDREKNSLSVIDTRNNALIKQLTLDKAPQAVQLDDEKNLLFVGNAESNSISVIDTKTLQISHTIRLN